MPHPLSAAAVAVFLDGATGSHPAGPSAEHAAAARPGVGFVSVAAVGYRAVASGAADLSGLVPGLVGTRVREGDELSYALLPEWDGAAADVRDGFAADAVSLDLVFDDGSTLGELQCSDQYGVPLDPRSQHEGRILQPDQWNLVRVDLAPATGRLVSGVRLRFEQTATTDGPWTGWLDAVSVHPRPRLPRRLSERARTRQGTLSDHVVSRGGTVPAVAVPNAFVMGIPVTRAHEYGWPYSWHADNGAENRPSIQAFATSHLPSPWLGERGAFHVMPALDTGAVPVRPAERALGFDHDRETAAPHRYRVELDGGIVAELTAAEHTVLARFQFPPGSRTGVILFDQVEGAGALTLPEVDPHGRDAVVLAYTDDALGDGMGTGKSRFGRAFLHAHVDRPVLATGMLPMESDEARVRGTDRSAARGWVRVSLGDDRIVEVRLATSFIGVDQARRNLTLDGAEDSFEVVAERAATEWDDWLGRIRLEGVSDEVQAALASAMYRVGLYPQRAHENLGTPDEPRPHYASPFHEAGAWTPERTGAQVVAGTLSVNHGFWDVYRTVWPLYALIAPMRASSLLDGFAEHYRAGGWTSRWSAPGPTDSMTGTSNDIVFAHAVAAGIPVRFDGAGPAGALDLEAAYQSALKNATVASPSPVTGRKGIETSIFRGWVDAGIEQGLGWTLDGSINDLATAVLAEEVARRLPAHDPRQERLATDAAYMRARAGSHRHVFDRRIGFYQGRYADGSFRWTPDTFDPTIWGYDYTETNGWGTAFSAPHDGAGLRALHGGADALAARLEELLTVAERGGDAVRGTFGTVVHEITEARNQRLGMLALSNQPAHHIPYMALFAGRPDFTQDLVRTAAERLFTGGEIGQGWPGDEDNGEMSAWWVFACIGLYPLVPGSAGYVLTAPIAPRVVLDVGAGRELVIEAPAADRTHRYIRSVTLNGRQWDSTFVPHDLIAAGGVLHFELAAEPQTWGAAASQWPPSLTEPGRLPTVTRDLTAERVTASWNGGDASVALDDSSATGFVELAEGDVLLVELPEPASPDFSTLTMQIAGEYGWAIECETADGWVTVDERREAFRWDRQTRPFRFAAPASTSWRIVARTRMCVTQWELLVADPPEPER